VRMAGFTCTTILDRSREAVIDEMMNENQCRGMTTCHIVANELKESPLLVVLYKSQFSC